MSDETPAPNSHLLLDHPDPEIVRGTVLRMPAAWPYEDSVDMMLVVLPTQRNALLVLSGLKAGLVAQVLPEESGRTGAISRDWLVANWNKWVMPETPLDQVAVIEELPI